MNTFFEVVGATIRIVLIALACLAFFWLIVLKVVSWLGAYLRISPPCPASLGWIVNNPLRRRYMRPVLDRVGIQSGETVLELGPGPGAFSIDAARRLEPQGKLIVVDIQADMIAQVKARVQQAGVANVEMHVANAYALPIEDNSVDRAFLVTVLPEIPDPVRGLHEIYRVLKPGGVFSTTEEFLDPDYPRRKTTIKWARAAGFELTERYGNVWVYTLNFRKRA
ncbi:MAG: class I SAM-dependent methyltransferase [Anaerolineae bacterium]|nr:class I SAM-dependent methyltransferase [Anaerolineae bacterium]